MVTIIMDTITIQTTTIRFRHHQLLLLLQFIHSMVIQIKDNFLLTLVINSLLIIKKVQVLLVDHRHHHTMVGYGENQ